MPEKDGPEVGGPEASPLWTSGEIAAATGGQARGEPFDVTGLAIDTREIKPGELFVALAGERDGHDFLDAALAAGAAGALISSPPPLRRGGEAAVRAIQVDDTLRALERLAAAARDRSAARRCAVTGSVGKTSVTQAIAAGLRLAGPAHAPVKSFNNHIGVPLTLARMPAGTERAVFEIGMNHAGEIAPLSRLVRPHVAVVTTVGAVHTENFPDGEAGVARAKAEVFEGLAPGGTAVLNAENAWFDLLAEAARARGARVVSFGRGEPCDAPLLGLERGAPSGPLGRAPPGAVVVARLHGRALRFPIGPSGAHWGLNSLAALLALDAMGVPLEPALQALAAFTPLEGRGADREVALASGGAFILVDESYNANPLSVEAALQTLAAAPATGRRLAVLTDMLELGSDAGARHAALIRPIEAAGIDLVFCAGPLMRALWDALPASSRGAWAGSAAELAPEVVGAVRPGDVVMVKGSKGSKASLVAEALAGLDAGSPTRAGAGGRG